MRGITENTIRDIYSYIEKVIRKNARYEIPFREVLDIKRNKMKG